MFERLKRRFLTPKAAPSPEPRSAEDPRGGDEGEAGVALATPAEPESPARARRRQYSEEERARLLAEFASSTQDVPQFADEKGIPRSTVRSWLSDDRKKRPKTTNRFTADERRAAVEAFLKSGRKRGDFARLWGCSAASLDNWLKRYRAEGPKGLETRVPERKAREPHSSRLPEAARDLVVKVGEEHPDFGARRIADELARFHGVKLSESGVRKILKERGVAAQAAPSKRRRPKSKLPRRFERAKPGELWQSDITSFVLRRHGRRVYLTVFLDDHSRYVVAWALATHQRTALVLEPLLEGIARFGKPREVLTDQGRQYFAWRGKSAFQKLLIKEGIAHVVSRAHHPETLGKCERLWKTVGDEFWDRASPQDLDDARRRLAHFFRHYNHFRPHQGIGGLVPADRFFGAESAVRETLEKELSANEVQLALGKAPRHSVYLAGKIGSEAISLYGERGRLLIETPDGGKRELAMKDLGIERSEKKEQDDGDEPGAGSAGNEGEGGPGGGTGRGEAQADAPQADGVSEGAEARVAGARPVGCGAGGGEEARARDVHADPGVLAGEEEQERGRRRPLGEAAARVAAEPDGAVGDDGGAPLAAAHAGGPRGLREARGRESGGAPEAHSEARAGAVADGGSGAGPASRPVAGEALGVGDEGRNPSCPKSEDQAQEGVSHEPSECGSERGCARRTTRGSRWQRWLRRKA